jgi:hypothetical protein
MQKQEEKSATPSVWSALASGFDLTARHPWLLLLPIILDLFIWLGPRLRFQALIEQMVAILPQEAQIVELSSELSQLAPQTNLFSVLSVPLMGVPVLLAGLAPERTPLVSRIIEIGSGTEWLLLFVFLSALGLLLTAIYYVAIGAVVRQQAPESGRDWLAITGRGWLRLAGLALLFMVIATIIYIPISLIGAIFFILNSTLGMMVVLLAPLVLIWVVIYLSFAPPGITLNDRSLLRAVKESVQLVQSNLVTVLTILLLILLLGAIVDWLLILADNGTWLTIFNILIHAFVNTGFVTAFFIIYQDRATKLVERAPA